MKVGQTTVPLNGAQSLWNSVILQAIEDATCWINPDRTDSNTRLLRAESVDARAWLTKPSREFDFICALAGLEPCRVRTYAQAKIAEAIANPPKPRRRNVKGSMPGVGENLSECQGDRGDRATLENPKIDFSQIRDLTPCP